MKTRTILIILLIINLISLNSVMSQTLLGNPLLGENNLDRFGGAVDIASEGNRIIIGAAGNDDIGSASGKVTVYEFNSTDWIQLGNEIKGTNSLEFLGSAVCISGNGNRIALGIRFNSDLYDNNGKVKVFELSNNEWIQLGDDLYGLDEHHRFGSSVSLSEDGSRLAIGTAINFNGSPDIDYTQIYELDNNQWVQLGANIYGLGSGDWSGLSTSLSSDGSIVAIGAPGQQAASGPRYVHIHQFINNSWVQLGSNINIEIEGEFGASVSLSNNGQKVIIGDPIFRTARIYQYTNDDWTQIGEDISEEDAPAFGGSVDISGDGNTALIGARLNSLNGTNSGSASLYSFDGNNWTQIGNTIHGEEQYQAGTSVALSEDGRTAVVGAPGENEGIVKVYSEIPVSNSNPSITKNGLTIFPNPSSGLYKIEGEIEGALYIASLDGKIIKAFTYTNNLIDLSDLENGNYFVYIISDEDIFTGKIIKIE